MKLNKKTIVVICIILLLAVFIVMPIAKSISKYGVVLIGLGWQDSPEDVIEFEIQELYDNHQEGKVGCYKIKTLIDEIRFENELYYIYISEANSFSVLGMVYDDEREKWHKTDLRVYPYDENIEISGDYNVKLSLWEGPEYYFTDDKSTVFGFMETGIAESYYVNDVKADVKVYTFEENGKTYSIDYFYANWPENIETHMDLDVYYIEYKK